MTNAILTIDHRGALGANSRASFLAAATRWQCDLVIQAHARNALHPACWKADAFRTCAHERLLIIDADTVINATCPDPFAQHEALRLHVVSDRQTHCPARDGAEAGEWKLVNGPRPLPAKFFNSGVMIADRSLGFLFDKVSALCRQHPDLVWHDQTPFNTVFDGSPLVNFLDETWNFLNPAGRVPDPWERMRRNIYHFAGNPRRNEQLEKVQWKN